MGKKRTHFIERAEGEERGMIKEGRKEVREGGRELKSNLNNHLWCHAGILASTCVMLIKQVFR